jgi:hypothetical protein
MRELGVNRNRSGCGNFDGHPTANVVLSATVRQQRRFCRSAAFFFGSLVILEAIS